MRKLSFLFGRRSYSEAGIFDLCRLLFLQGEGVLILQGQECNGKVYFQSSQLKRTKAVDTQCILENAYASTEIQMLILKDLQCLYLRECQRQTKGGRGFLDHTYLLIWLKCIAIHEQADRKFRLFIFQYMDFEMSFLLPCARRRKGDVVTQMPPTSLLHH